MAVFPGALSEEEEEALHRKYSKMRKQEEWRGYIATSGLDHKLNIFDVRTYWPLHGNDPTETERLEPRRRMKGRSSSGNLERRKKLVASGDRRDGVRRSMEQKVKMQKMAASIPSLPPSAVTRFNK